MIRPMTLGEGEKTIATAEDTDHHRRQNGRRKEMKRRMEGKGSYNDDDAARQSGYACGSGRYRRRHSSPDIARRTDRAIKVNEKSSRG